MQHFSLGPIDFSGCEIVNVKNMSVSKNGSSVIAATLGDLACLEVEGLKLLPCIRCVDCQWVAVKRWADCGRTIKEMDPSCAAFRESVLALLWNRGAYDANLFSSGPTKDLDVNRVSRAVAKSASLGFDLDACSSNDPVDIYRVKRWATVFLARSPGPNDAGHRRCHASLFTTGVPAAWDFVC